MLPSLLINFDPLCVSIAGFVLLNLILGLTTRNFILCFFHQYEKTEKGLIAILIFVSLIVVSTMAGGVLNHPNYSSLLIAAICLCLFSFSFNRKPKPSIEVDKTIHLFSDVVSKPCLVVLCLLSVAFFLCYTVIGTKLSVLPVSHWDDLTYHFYFPAYWLQTGLFENPITPFGDLAPTYSPMNTEFINFWVLAPFKSDVAARLVQHLFLLVCGYSIFVIIRSRTKNQMISAYYGLVFMSIPLILSQGFDVATVQTLSNDISSGAFFIMMLFFFLDYAERKTHTASALAGISFGLFLGSKYIAIVYSIPFLIFFLIHLWRQKNKNASSIDGFLFTIFSVLMGGFTYIRNWYQTGNPVYPSEVKIFNVLLFEGIYDLEYLHQYPYYWMFSWKEFFFTSGYGYGLPIVCSLSLFLFLHYVMYHRTSGRFREIDATSIFIAVLPWFELVLFYYLIPFRNYRFLLYPVMVGFIACAVFYRFSPRLSWLIAFSFLPYMLHSIYMLTEKNKIYLQSGIVKTIVVSVLILIVIYICRSSVRRKKLMVTGIVSVGFILGCHAIYRSLKAELTKPAESYYSNTRYSGTHAAGWNWLRTYTSDYAKGFRIAYCGTNGYYPLLGNQFQNRACYVPVNNMGVLAHEFKTRDYRVKPDPYIWLDNMMEYDIDLLVCKSPVISGIPKFTEEDLWASNMKEFSLLYEDKCTHIYAFEAHQSKENSQLISCGITLYSLQCQPEETICAGGSGQLYFHWLIPETLQNHRIDFEYEIDGCWQSNEKYPSPGNTSGCIHRMEYSIPETARSGSYPIKVEIEDTSSGFSETIMTRTIEVKDGPDCETNIIPTIISPADEEIITETTQFSWSAVEGALGYSIEFIFPDGKTWSIISKTNNLKLYLKSGALKALPRGSYRWNVRVWGPNGLTGNPSPTIVFYRQ